MNLYHYSSFTTAKRYILKNRSLLLNPIYKTNDPRENKNFRFGYIRYSNSDDITEHNHNSHYENLVNKMLRRNIKVTCFSLDYEIDGFDYKGYNLSRMWATYGEMHRGVCLEIDYEKFIELNNNILSENNFKRITYVPPGNNEDFPTFDVTLAEEIGVEEYIKLFITQHYDYFYFTKLKDWETEHEMRIIYEGNSNQKEFCSIDNCITSVILGVNTTKHKIKKIRGLVPDDCQFVKVEFEFDKLLLRAID